ncbi:MAG: GNAT family N-acetyltransferase [Pseudomonadota bacterium]
MARSARRLRSARPEDAPHIEAFLRERADTSMFLRSNLRHHGPCGGDAAVATRMWLDGDPIAGVIGLTTHGYMTVQMPSGIPGDLRAVLQGETVAGMTGPPEQVAELLSVLDLSHAAESPGPRIEPLYRLNLCDAKVPDGETRLRSASTKDLPSLALWRAATNEEILGLAGSVEEAADQLSVMIGDDRLRVLEANGQPVSMTGFNATLPDMVQIGGVYTPPSLRRRGYARRAVALHLLEARAAGVETAILFAANAPACRAYEAIGFQRIGSYRLVMFKTTRRIG